ncbi:MAG: sodium ion-translocating decarboxylase subunit beta [bacterium]|nr:sodium ion-translocating decarboxylase subunit beta [bacterium]
MSGIIEFIGRTGFFNMTLTSALMIVVGIILIILAIKKNWEPLLLIPIGFGVIVGNIPFTPGQMIGVYEPGSYLNIIYQGVKQGIYPPLIFLGLGAMTDFSALLANPKLIFLGAAAQVGIFATLLGALALGFTLPEAASIGIIGGADGPTTIFVTSNLAPKLVSATAIAGYSYMALVPLIQPPIMRLLTTQKERVIKMKPLRQVSKTEKIIFPIAGIIITCCLAPGAIPLLGSLFFGNILKECCVTERLANTARNSMIDIVTILLGFSVGCSTQADKFLKWNSIKIFLLGAAAFIIATSCGVLFAKLMNLISKDKINPLIGSAGVSAVPMAARVSQVEGQKYDKSNYLLLHAMGPNVAGVIGSAIAAGILLDLLK